MIFVLSVPLLLGFMLLLPFLEWYVGVTVSDETLTEAVEQMHESVREVLRDTPSDAKRYAGDGSYQRNGHEETAPYMRASTWKLFMSNFDARAADDDAHVATSNTGKPLPAFRVRHNGAMTDEVAVVVEARFQNSAFNRKFNNDATLAEREAVIHDLHSAQNS